MPTKKGKAKILMIEDDFFFLKIYGEKLTRAGFKFIEATNAQDGIYKAINEVPDLILLDIVLPKKIGFEVLKELKTYPKIKHIPVIILSALGGKSVIQKGLNLGASDYFVKGDLLISEIVDKIKEWISKIRGGTEEK